MACGLPVTQSLARCDPVLTVAGLFFIIQETWEISRFFNFAENSNTHFTPEVNILDWVGEQEIELRDVRVFTEDFLKRESVLLFVIYVHVCFCVGACARMCKYLEAGRGYRVPWSRNYMLL